MERRVAAEGLAPFYCCSFSCRTIVYKAMLTGGQLPSFYTDFKYPEFETAIAVFHERYATNTKPSWELTQPFRLLAHNGEINTLWGNRNAMTMRQPMLANPLFGDKGDRVRDVIDPRGSDSTSLDNAMELLVRADRSTVHAAMMLVPAAWEKYPDMDADVKAFYEYHQCVIEPWDGPAALAFSDGITVAAALDRNGLRPCRYKIREDGMVALGSEVGLVDFDPREVVESGKLGSGETFLVDTQRNLILRSLEAKREIATRKPYARWVARYMSTLPPSGGSEPLVTSTSALLPLQVAFGFGFEDVRLGLESMGASGAEPVWSMGDDTPIAPLSSFPHGIYAYFRQRFAQVTNPPIDSLRETQVMSLRMHLGRRGSPLEERPSHARMLRVEHPVLLPEEMRALRDFALFDIHTLDVTFVPGEESGALAASLERLSRDAEVAVRRGARILILSDRATSATRAPVPMLLALGAVRQHLIARGLRARVGLVVECGDAYDPHHVATLVGYGAEAVHPWLAMETVAAIYAEAPEHGRRDADAERPLPAEALTRYRSAVEKGLLKILAKMGIATLSSFCGAQIFEALGLGGEVIDRCFTGTVSPLGGLGFVELEEDVRARHSAAWPREGASPHTLPDFGRVRFRKDGDDHGWAPTTVVALQRATGSAKSGGGESDVAYRDFVSKNAERRAAGPRDLLRLRAATPVPIDEVEPVESIRRRFVSSAMSLGALSPEAHSTITIAMNRIGRALQLGRGGRGSATLCGAPQRRSCGQPHQAGGIGALRRDDGVSHARRGAGDQDRAGGEARRRRATPRAQGDGADRPTAPRRPRRVAHLAPAASRHLLDRGSGPAGARPQDGEPTRPHRRKARGRGRGRDRRCRGREGVRRLRVDCRSQRRDGCVGVVVHQACRRPVGARAGRDAAGAGRKWPAPPHRGPRGWRLQDGARRGDRGNPRCGVVRLRHGAAGGHRLPDGAPMPYQHLPHRRGDAARGPARQVSRDAGAGGGVLHPRGAGGAGAPRLARRAFAAGDHWTNRAPGARRASRAPARRAAGSLDDPHPQREERRAFGAHGRAECAAGDVVARHADPARLRAVRGARTPVLGTLPDPQSPPHGGRARGRDDRRASWRRRSRPGDDAPALHRDRGAELRRIRAPGHAPRSRGGGQRLRGEGALRRRADAASVPRGSLCAGESPAPHPR